MQTFFIGLFLLCAGTLTYEIVLTRLLSVVCWYYLAFVSVSMAMFGMTAGALLVQVRPGLERHLARNGTRIVKLFLHLSKEEQRKRFINRIETPSKNWKFSSADIA